MHDGIKLRAELWNDGQGVRSLLLMVRFDQCLAFLLKQDLDTRLWTCGIGRFPAEALWSSRTWFADNLDMTVDPEAMIFGVGLLHAGSGWLFNLLIKSWIPGPSSIKCGLTRNPETMKNLSPWMVENEITDNPRFRRLREIGIRPQRCETNFIGMIMNSPLRPTPPREPHPIPGERICVMDADGPIEAIPGDSKRWKGVADEAVEKMKAFEAAWHYPLADALRPNDIIFLNPSRWTVFLSAYYTAPGIAGTYRRQAGQLYPFLAMVLPHDPETVALIDAGRPYERRLCELLNGLHIIPHEGGFTPAKLRHLRGMKPWSGMLWFHNYLINIAWLPADRIPLLTRLDNGCEMGSLWTSKLSEWSTVSGLDFIRLTDRMPEIEEGYVIHPANDMLRRCNETLITPLLPDTDAHIQRKVAARFLFGGLDLISVKTLSGRWHARMELFENTLPPGKDLVTWPALFEPFERDDIRITCLTVQSELRAEGASFRDREGVMGLGHCVGGYGLRCFLGKSHVASVRRLQNGEWIRISTLEIGMATKGRPTLAQHRGASNGPPPTDAIQAVKLLISSLREGAVPMAPAALAGREKAEFKDGVRWQAPESQKAAWDAWRPFAPKRIAALDIDGLKSLLHGIEIDILAEHPPDWQPLQNIFGE